jgi:hypothetical protein
MILYMKHCDYEVLVSSEVYRKIRCPICGTLIEPQSLERMRRKQQIGEHVKKGEIKDLANNILNITDNKFNIIKDNYIEATDTVIRDLSLLIGAFSELYMYKAARNCARLLGMIYVYKGYNKAIKNSMDLAELQRAVLWFQASKDIIMESIAHLLIGRKAMQGDDCEDGIEYAKLLRIAVFEFNEAKISQEPFSLKDIDKKYLELTKTLGVIDEDETDIQDVKETLKIISNYSERNLQVAEQTLPEAVRAWGEVQKAKILAQAIQYHGDVIAKSIEEHGELVRKGLVELGDTIEKGLNNLGGSIGSGLYSISDGLKDVSCNIARTGSMMSGSMNKLSKSVMVGAGILGTAGVIGLGLHSGILAKSLTSLGGGVSSAIRSGAPWESQLTSFTLDKIRGI